MIVLCDLWVFVLQYCVYNQYGNDVFSADAWECNQSGWTRTAEVLDHMTQLAKEQHQGKIYWIQQIRH